MMEIRLARSLRRFAIFFGYCVVLAALLFLFFILKSLWHMVHAHPW